ncbi:unnamed protein product [Zymoseptoria tritici ST99CH_1E4]|uniref:Tat pathway signal sequence n=1 Tax=Zymoseptoria tritici ST99CH_1E4 TaxID=1276532 RepID=A0A2H1H8I9_ZYMTR|nr:unnamed protein product [Zymoseptoria tritici ST99CH_1E4]
MAYDEYVPVSPSEESFTKEEWPSDTQWPLHAKRFRWQRPLVIGLAVCSVIALYTWIVLYAASIWWAEKMLHGADVVDTPLRPWMRYQSKAFEHKHWAKDYPLAGYPSDELDARWIELQKTFYTEVPVEYMEKIGKTDEGVQLPNGNYAASYSVMHLLHCVQRLQQSYFPDVYFPNMTEREEFLQLEHNLHCIHMLADSVMCNADVVPVPIVWRANTPMPTGDFNVAHECVDWDLLHEGMLEKRIDPWEKGTFVHPIFGEVTSHVGENRIGFGEPGNIMKKDKNGKWIV